MLDKKKKKTAPLLILFIFLLFLLFLAFLSLEDPPTPPPQPWWLLPTTPPASSFPLVQYTAIPSLYFSFSLKAFFLKSACPPQQCCSTCLPVSLKHHQWIGRDVLLWFWGWYSEQSKKKAEGGLLGALRSLNFFSPFRKDVSFHFSFTVYPIHLCHVF